MKRLINKVLLACITLSVVAPASGFDGSAFNGLGNAYLAISTGIYIACPIAGGIVALGLKKLYDKWYGVPVSGSSTLPKVATFVGGAFLAGYAARKYFRDIDLLQMRFPY